MSALPAIDRTAINRANSEHSTGPRTAEGKARSSQNALRHGLLSRTPVLPSEDQAAYEQHCRQFFEQYRPATPTEAQLTQELADTAWRLNRIPLLETKLLSRAAQSVELDIADTMRTLSTLSLHGARLSRQFQKTLQQLREIQADRLKAAPAIAEVHKHKGIPRNPAEAGFVFNPAARSDKERPQAHAESRSPLLPTCSQASAAHP